MIPHETNRGGFNGNEKVFYRSSGYGIFGRM